MSSSSSSFSSGFGSALPLIHCKYCNRLVVEQTSTKQESKRRQFYRCVFMKPDGKQCEFFHWQGSYAALLIKDGHVTDAEEVNKVLAIALEDHDKAISCIAQLIKDMKPNQPVANMEKLEAKMAELEDEMASLKNLIAQNDKTTTAALGDMRTDLQKLKGSNAVKLSYMALFVVLLALIGWFVMGRKGQQAYGLFPQLKSTSNE